MHAAMASILDPSDEAAANGARHEFNPLRNRETLRRPSQLAARGDFWSAAAPKRLRRGVADAQAAWTHYFHERDAAAPQHPATHTHPPPGGSPTSLAG